MKLVTYESGKQLRVGVVEGEFVVNVRSACSPKMASQIRKSMQPFAWRC